MKKRDELKKEVNGVLQGLLEGLEQIKKGIEGMDEARFGHKPKNGGWSIQELLCHLYNGEIVFSYQVKKVLSEDDPTLLGLDTDRWARRLDYSSEEPRQAILLYRLLRIHILRILKKRPVEDFHRHGIHGEKGVLSLLDLLHERVQQDQEAIDHLEKTIQGLGEAPTEDFP